MRTEFMQFNKPENVSLLLNEMKNRHSNGYESIRDSIIKQISAYYHKYSFNSQNPQKLGKLKFLVGLSGGIDSTLVTYLAVSAVGNKNVIPVTMPARNDDTECTEKSKMIRDLLKIDEPSMPYVIPIGGIVKASIELINSLKCDQIRINTDTKSQTFLDKIRIGNFASRTRIKVLYDLANALNGRILGTGNRIEYLQGYAAKYGTPISYDYGVLDELYKVDIIELSKLMGIPDEIINAVPSTGYYTCQSHEQELGAAMAEQDAVLYLLFEKNLDVETIVTQHGIKKEFVELLIKRYQDSEHKRMLKQEHVHLNG